VGSLAEEKKKKKIKGVDGERQTSQFLGKRRAKRAEEKSSKTQVEANPSNHLGASIKRGGEAQPYWKKLRNVEKKST